MLGTNAGPLLLLLVLAAWSLLIIWHVQPLVVVVTDPHQSSFAQNVDAIAAAIDGPTSKSPVASPTVETGSLNEALSHLSINKVLLASAKFDTGCCLNNRLQAVVRSVQDGCQRSAADRNSTKRTAVQLPPELEDGGILRQGGYQLFDNQSIHLVKDVAFQQMDGCILLKASERADHHSDSILEIYDVGYQFDDRGPVYTWMYQHLNPMLSPLLGAAWKACYSHSLDHGSYVAVHMRDVEKDWSRFCKRKGKGPCHTPEHIATAVKQLLHSSSGGQTNASSVLLIHGNQLRKLFQEGGGRGPQEVFRQRFSYLTVVHPSSNATTTTSLACRSHLANLTYNQLALLDFWAGLRAVAFVGTHLSTFSNALARARHLRGKPNSNYLYSCGGANKNRILVRRNDGGLLLKTTCGNSTVAKSR